jgi:paraquat-inducible protein A
MVDIFVDTLMAALIQIQGLMVIEVGVGAAIQTIENVDRG